VQTPVIKFEVLMKRLRVMRPYFSVADVVVVLGIMTINGMGEGNEARLGYVFTFARALARLLIASATYPALGDALQRLMDASDAGRGVDHAAGMTPGSTTSDASPTLNTAASLRAQGAAFIRGLCSLQLERSATAEEVSAFVRTLELARASACSVGVCN
jgi:hypothetical protein